MVLLVSGATVVVRETPNVGVLIVPGAGNAPESCLIPGRPWVTDEIKITLGLQHDGLRRLVGHDRLGRLERAIEAADQSVPAALPAREGE